MKTALPIKISTIQEAKEFLSDLELHGESFHPEDDAHDIIWHCSEPTDIEKEQLNILMEQIRAIKDFDPCEYILDLRDTI
jgi:pimeloyl-CoA synthetase